MAKATPNQELCERLEKVEETANEVVENMARLDERFTAMDARSCEQHANIRRGLEQIDLLLRGDGDSKDKQGLKRRLEAAETKLESREKHLVALWGTISAMVVAMCGAAAHFVFNLFGTGPKN